MIGFIFKRLLYTIVVMFIASVAIFYALRVAPGDPVNAILNPTAMEQARAALRARLGLDLPIWEQYFVYVKHIFQGDTGESLLTGKTIPHVLATYGLRSLVLAGTALLIAYAIAIPLGVLAAVRRNSIWDQAAMFFANLGMGIPSFWLALLLILLFGATLHWLPIEGSGDLRHLILPASVLSVESLAVTMRLMRSSMLEQLGQDYVRTLRAKGVRGRRIIWVHVVRNALIPIISLSGILTYKKTQALQDAARFVPLDRLMVETDSPYLAPVPHRGKRNEPMHVAVTGARLAETPGSGRADPSPRQASQSPRPTSPTRRAARRRPPGCGGDSRRTASSCSAP